MSFKSIGQVAAYKPLYKCGIEELAAHYGNADPSGGVMFARTAEDRPEKDTARQLILDLFARDKWDRHLRMLTMPGLHWKFERKLLGKREGDWFRRKAPKRTLFTCVENDRPIYYSAVTHMPGSQTPGSLIKPARCDFGERGVKTKYASFFFANVDDLMACGWSGWDAVWLDYTGPLTVKRLRLIADFYERCVGEILIVTAMKARWPAETGAAIAKAGGHSEWLREHLAGEVLHDIDYFDTVPMVQFAVRRASILPQHKAPLPPKPAAPKGLWMYDC
jgi:hypothetical protein